MLYMQIYAHRAAGVYLHIQCSEIILREVKAMEFLSYLISGISLGSVYAIIALGYTMVYGIAKMLNFAHGDIIMIGGYVSFVAVSSLGLNPWIAMVIAMAVCTLLGVLIERFAYKPLRHCDRCILPAAECGTPHLGC